MTKIVENEFIYLRKLSKEDAQDFFALNSDKEVLKYTGDSAFDHVDTAKDFLNNYPNYERDGYGRWAVCLQENDVFIGWCGLNKSKENGETDIGFRFFKKYWGRGYATTAAKLCLAYGFQDLKLKYIIANAYEENSASIRVLEKCEMQFVDHCLYDDRKAVLYRADAVKIQLINASDTYPLRKSILRNQLPLPVAFSGDMDPSTFHLGAIKRGERKTVGVATFVVNSLPELTGAQCQLRGMAISETRQGAGIGTLLLLEGLRLLQNISCKYIWCNARVIAVEFYKKQGFEILGTSFEIKYIGTHYTMFKKI